MEFEVDICANCRFESLNPADQQHAGNTKNCSEYEHGVDLVLHSTNLFAHLNALLRHHIESDHHDEFEYRLQNADARKSVQRQRGGPLDGLSQVVCCL